MHKFTYDFLKNNTITTELFSLSNILTDLKTRTELAKNINEMLFNKLESVAIKESVIGSNAIEGIYTSEKRVNDIVENHAKPLTHNEEEISGYYDAIKYIKENYKYLSFDEITIKKIHSLLLSRVSGSKNGEYKQTDNIIAEKNIDGTIKRVIFTPTKAKDVFTSMKELCLAYQVAKDDSNIPSLLLIPCVIVDFLCIHPFSDGNGRVSRLLTLLLLYKEGYSIGKYVSLEKQINTYRNVYYEKLELCSKNWHESRNTYYPFIIFIYQILYECYKEMNKKLLYIGINAKKNQRVENVILNSIVPISKADIQNLLPDVSLITIETTISKLLKIQKIRKIGTYRNAKYIKY